MESGTSDQTVVPNREGDESSMVLDPSIQASLSRTSSVVSENIAAGDTLSAGMEPSLPVASSKNSEIIEVEDDPSPGMEPSLQTTSSTLDPAEDEQSSEIGSTSSPEMEVNPFIKDLSRTKYERDDLAKHCIELKKKLDNGLQEKNVYAFLDHNMMEIQKEVQELFYLFEAIEFMILVGRPLCETHPKKDPNQLGFIVDYLRIDIHYRLFIHALSHGTKLRRNRRFGLFHSDPVIVDNLSFEATNFMVFLINKVQEEEEDIMYPSLVLQGKKTLLTKCVHSYEEETISTFICLVVNDEDNEAEDLFKSLLKYMKPSDIINRGRVYNYALQKAQELYKVYQFLSSPSLSQRYKDVVNHNNRLNWFGTEYNYQVKVHRFLVDLYLRDVDLKQKVDWEFVEQHDYPYLIHCVWECHKRMMVPHDVTKYKWTPLQLKYVLTSSAAITFGGIDIIKHLLEVWPTLVNAPYKGVVALHAAVWKGNEEVIEFLLEQKELDINVCTIRLLTGDDVEKLLKKWMPELDMIAFNKGVLKCKENSPPIATLLLKDHEDLIKDLLRQQQIEVSFEGLVDASKFTTKYGKKWNRNRWNMPTYQTALHIATSQANVNAVKLLCDAPKSHQQRLRCHEEDEENRTPLDILNGGPNKVVEDFNLSEIEKILLSKQDVQNGIDRLFQYRQALVDAVNTILVGAALIASVTFAGWLQPPLGYAQSYDLAAPYSAPPDTYDSYLGVQGNLGIKAFALFNSLSFFFAIATVIVGADAAFPQPTNKYIGHVVKIMHRLLRRAVKLLVISLVCVLGAFGSAAIVVLPPSLFFRKDLVLSIIIGGGVCSIVLWQLLSRHSEKVNKLNDSIRHIIKFTKVF